MVVGADATYVPKQIYKGVRNTAADIKKMSQLLGGQCSLGYIFNKTKGLLVSDATDSFLSGLAGSAGVTLRNVRVGVSNPVNEDWFDLTTPKSIEIGLNTQKAGWDGGISVNQKSINVYKEYKSTKEKLSE